jgi:deoxyuridine 5'-triphosphate nucleotidohydrolase
MRLNDLDDVEFDDIVIKLIYETCSKKICKINKDILFSFNIEEDLEFLAKRINIPYDIIDDILIYKNSNLIDLLYKLNIRNPTNFAVEYTLYNTFLKTATVCNVKKLDEDAIIPFKTRGSDAGYDLTIIKKLKQINSVCALYGTGISIQPDSGYYSEIVPRSSIIKSGYMLANNVGIIDSSYTGELMIALVKVAPEAPEITLPYRGFQLIFKKQEYVKMYEISDLNETTRSSGGFGSTN